MLMPLCGIVGIIIDFLAQLIKEVVTDEEINDLKDKSQKINETVITGGLEKVKNNDNNLPNSTDDVQEIKKVNWLSFKNVLTSFNFQPVFISITNAILVLAIGFSIIYMSMLHGTNSPSKLC